MTEPELTTEPRKLRCLVRGYTRKVTKTTQEATLNLPISESTPDIFAVNTALAMEQFGVLIAESAELAGYLENKDLTLSGRQVEDKTVLLRFPQGTKWHDGRDLLPPYWEEAKLHEFDGWIAPTEKTGDTITQGDYEYWHAPFVRYVVTAVDEGDEPTPIKAFNAGVQAMRSRLLAIANEHAARVSEMPEADPLRQAIEALAEELYGESYPPVPEGFWSNDK